MNSSGQAKAYVSKNHCKTAKFFILWRELEVSSWSLSSSFSERYRKAGHNSEKNSHNYKVSKN